MQSNVVKKNLYVGIIYQVCVMLTGFAIRKYISDYLGVYNLGVIGVFENAMSMLILLNFGVGDACMYYLYKYFAENNHYKISEVYSFYKHIFKKVALGIFIFGLFILFNINLIIDIEGNKAFLQIVFGAFLLKTVLYNLLICPRTCFQCDGKRYVIIFSDLIAMMIFLVLKIFFIIKTMNLLIYILLLTIETLISAAYIFFRFKKEYHYIDTNLKETNKQLEKDIFNYAKSLFVSNINYFVYNSTDNIVLSKFCGTIVVGQLSYYYIIVNAIKALVVQISNAIEAQIIKNYNIDSTDKKFQYDFSMFFYFAICSIFVTCLNVLTNDFIKLFFGQQYVLDKSITYLMSTILLLDVMKMPSSMVVISRKLVNKEVPFTTLAMFLNVSLSILLAIKIGPQGVLLATIISEIALLIGDELLAIHSDLNLDLKIVFKKFLYLAVIIANTYIANLITIPVNNYLNWVVNGFICLFVALFTSLLFVRTNEFKTLLNYLSSYIKRK
ncbi:MAG: hypothetical protein Q4B60_00230 [Erysipelotrichaceae bacterium]|nr:hypothetical protein [Erysipelotrichaceae bacterium]